MPEAPPAPMPEAQPAPMPEAQAAPMPDAQPAPMPEAPPAPRRARRILARSVHYATDRGLIEIRLSRPDEGEECAITLEPIAEARLHFLPDDAVQCPVASGPGRALSKGTLPCGHGFSALALLYHFAKNGMRCPSCRAGVDARMTPQSVPQHLRAAFQRHLEREDAAERQESDEENMRLAAEILQREVTGATPAFFAGRVFATVYAFEAMDSLAPVSVQTLPLALIPAPGDRSGGSASSGSSRGGGSGSATAGSSSSTSTTSPRSSHSILRFESSSSSCRQLAINLRLMGAEVRAYQIVVGTRDLADGIVMLNRAGRADGAFVFNRTSRFPAVPGAMRFGAWGQGGQSVDVSGRDGLIEGVRYTVPKDELVLALTAIALDAV